METHDTFIVTLFRDPQRSAEPRGRIRHVASGREHTFVNLSELTRLLCASEDNGTVVDEFVTHESQKGER